MLKSKEQLKKLPADSTDITNTDIFDYYTNRNTDVENWCLADYAALFKRINTTTHNNETVTLEREKPKIIRYVRYALIKDEAKYYREQCLLFLPWRNEVLDINNKNCKELYLQNLETIQINQRKYNIIADEDLNTVRPHGNLDNESDTSSDREQHHSVNLFEQGDIENCEHTKTNVPELNRYTSPQKLSREDLLNKLVRLNHKQSQIFMHILKQVKLEFPFYIYIGGSAGVGKTELIHALFQTITIHYDNLVGASPDTMKV